MRLPQSCAAKKACNRYFMRSDKIIYYRTLATFLCQAQLAAKKLWLRIPWLLYSNMVQPRKKLISCMSAGKYSKNLTAFTIIRTIAWRIGRHVIMCWCLMSLFLLVFELFLCRLLWTVWSMVWFLVAHSILIGMLFTWYMSISAIYSSKCVPVNWQ